VPGASGQKSGKGNDGQANDVSHDALPYLLSKLYGTGELKSTLRRPRSGLNENSPALQRWVTAVGSSESVKRTIEQTYGPTTI
jgi:hypothetical protein